MWWTVNVNVLLMLAFAHCYSYWWWDVESMHDDVIKWKHFPRYWPFVRGIHRSPVNSLHKGLWRGALMFSLICVWISGWVNNREAGDQRRYRAHYDVIVMVYRHETTLEKWLYATVFFRDVITHPRLICSGLLKTQFSHFVGIIHALNSMGFTITLTS